MVRWRALALLIPLTALVLGGLLVRPRRARQAAELVGWPWPAAVTESPYPGVTRWRAAAADGTRVWLVAFDRGLNPRLELGLYDHDAHDAQPFDNRVDLGSGSLADAVGPGVVAVWNGSFFNPQLPDQPPGTAAHVAPVVLDQVAHYNVGNHRWTFGAKTVDGRQTLRVEHLPAYARLAETFDFAAGGVQCLVRDGVPLRLPRGELGESRSASPAEVGANTGADELATSRVALGWSGDSRRIELLLVREGDARGAGWTLAELQRFWRARGTANAVNLDGGPSAQALLRERDGGWLLLPPRGGPPRRVGSALNGGPRGGSIMSFYVRDRRPGAEGSG